MASLDTAIANIALPTIALVLGAAFAAVGCVMSMFAWSRRRNNAHRHQPRRFCFAFFAKSGFAADNPPSSLCPA